MTIESASKSVIEICYFTPGKGAAAYDEHWIESADHGRAFIRQFATMTEALAWMAVHIDNLPADTCKIEFTDITKL